MKLTVIHVNAEQYSGLYTELIDANFRRVKAETTELRHLYVQRLRRATDTVFAYPTLLNRLDVVEQALVARDEGADAVLVACSGDPGVAEARTLLDVPVVGPMEAALHLAATYGRKLGIVTVQDRTWVEYCEALTEASGLGGRLAGVRSIGIPSARAFTEGFTQPQAIAAEVEAQARRLVEDGAGAIVIGSAGLSVMSSAAGLAALPDAGVPIFDCLSAGLKMAELRAQLQQRLGVPPCSRIGWGERLPDADIARLRKLFGLNAAAA
ncbi:MAG: aspartate/glutamate racemase family protein [Burkholderiaceae bacterium]|jgi:allantoin racemase|nr:aspartate/glutamate racemase family protein [Burkholderiaceae bacterium]